MGYYIERDETVAEAFGRIALKQADDALDAVDRAATSADNAEPIHDCRTHCKKLRGLIRLVRPALDTKTFRAANEAFRDAARGLSEMRDAQALLATFDDVVASSTNGTPADSLRRVREELARRAGDGEVLDEPAFELSRDLLRLGRAQLHHPDLHARGWNAVRGGLADTYGRGRDALDVVRDDPTADNFHELRKRAKYSWYHIRLLAPSAPSVLQPLGKQFDRLADGLGDAHDLAVLGEQLDQDPDAFGGAAYVHDVRNLLHDRREQLERAAVIRAVQLYAEPPKPFARRLERYWDAWRED